MFPNVFFLLAITVAVVSILDPCCAFVSSRSDSVGAALQSSEGPWGSWSNNFYCKEGTFAVGFDLGVEPYIIGDDTAANWFRLVCDDGEVIKANNEAAWGTTVGSVRCGAEFNLLGFKSKVEVVQGGADDTALNSVKGLCATASTSGTEEKEPSNGGAWGDWAVSYARCGPDQVVCGFRQKVEAYVGSGDDTALNAVQLYCCPKDICKGDNVGCTVGANECCSKYYCDDDQWSGDECEPRIKHGYECTKKFNSVEKACEGSSPSWKSGCRKIGVGNRAFCGKCVADDGVTVFHTTYDLKAGQIDSYYHCCDGYSFVHGWLYLLDYSGYCAPYTYSSAPSPYVIELGVVGVLVLMLFFWTAYNLCVCIKTQQAEHKYQVANDGTQIQMCQA